jgi:hypothetical protein
MKKQFYFVLFLVAFFGRANAQTSRPGVLVVGNGNAAFAAAFQSAISGVKTTILLQAGGFDISPITNQLNSGVQATFLKKYKDFAQLDAKAKLSQFDKPKANQAIGIWADSLENLTIIKNVLWVKADRAGKNWSFKLSDGKTIRPKVLINPGDSKLNAALKINTAIATNWQQLAYENTVYRTSVVGSDGHFLSLYQLMVPDQENLIWVSDPNDMLIGQAAGATAAYAAFFDTKTSLVNLKKIQGELVNYKLNLLPFSDVGLADSNWKAIQLVGITGVIKAKVTAETAEFLPEQVITTAEIKQPIKDSYYKAQIWFDDYKKPTLTINSTLEMIAYVGNKSLESMKKEIEKKWKQSYHFQSALDFDRQINRREFAVLMQDYMPPFNVNVDDKGRIIR